MKNTVEKRTAETILETPFTVTIGVKSYEVARPSLATLIEVSKFISQLPENIEKMEDDEDQMLREVLSVAVDCRYLGDIVAILILGSKGLKARKFNPQKRRRFSFMPVSKEETIDPQRELANEVNEEMNAKEIFELIITLLQKLEVAFFLSTIIFLKEVNLLRKTKF